jgi:hypothetical protein
MTRSLDPRLVFAKTPDGVAEVAARSHALSAASRRILILIDGRRRLSDLPPFARAGELEPIVDDLEARGLIALAGIADDPLEEERLARERHDRESLARLKQDLQGVFAKALGPAGAVLDARLRDCIGMDPLRVLLREAIDTVQRERGRPAAERIIARARPAFEAWAAGPRRL